MVEIEIDGETLQAEQGSMIIEVADANNIRIPRFCYHKKLSVAANCRMCLVEVEKMPKTVPACATPVTPGMKVFTKSQKALDSQRAVMEFLLINHPLDCPICDQGGECELQDNSMGYGLDTSPYEETKRVIVDEDIGPLVETNLTRCIQCTRCVRFGQEIAGMRELGMTGRGEHSEIRTFVRHALYSEVSANIIDLCPVGALTSKPFLYSARAWELDQAESIAPHDALGSNIYLHTRRDQVMRVVPRENDNINETWLSDRDRFSYTAINSQERLQAPMVKRNGQWHATDWETALTFAVSSIKNCQQKNGPQSLLALSSASASLEEYYLLARLCKAIGASDVSYHLRDTDVSDSHILKQPHFDLTLNDIEQQKAILLVGTEIMREMPLLGLRYRKAVLAGCNVDVINPADFIFNFNVNNKIITQPQLLVNELAAVLKALLAQNPNHPLQSLQQHPLLQNVQLNDAHQAIATRLQQNDQAFIYLGAIAYHLPQAASLRLLAAAIATVSNSKWGMHTDGSNTAGLAQLQQASGLAQQSAQALSQNLKHKAIILHNIEPELDCANPQQMDQLLQQAEMVVACTPFKSAYLSQVADVLLPIATLAETSGTFINLMGNQQSFKGYVTPRAEARPAWKVFRVLANLFDLADFTYTSTQDVLEEIQQTITFNQDSNLSNEAIMQGFASIQASSKPNLAANEFMRITQWPIYRIDNLVRRAEPLQNSGTASPVAVYINASSLKKLGLQEGDSVIVEQLGRSSLTLKLNPLLADDLALIPAGFSETAMLAASFDRVSIMADATRRCEEG